MKRKNVLFALCLMAMSVCSYAQTQSGILFGGGLGFENRTMNKGNSEYLKGTRFKDTYDYSGFLGYRFQCKRLRDSTLPEREKRLIGIIH